MNGKNAALAVTAAVALAAVGAIIWAVLPEKNDPEPAVSNTAISTPDVSSSTNDVTSSEAESDVSEPEVSAPDTSSEQEVSESSSESDPVPKRQFKIDILLAPKGFKVKDDYILEIARAEDVKSSPTSHLDKQDNIFYSAAVINGVTELELENGDYELCIYPDGHPDNFKRYSWKIDNNTTDRDLQLIVTEKVEPGQIMIVLHWGKTPKDLDSYFSGEGELVYTWNKIGKHARRDIDSINGDGIETITVTDPHGSFLYVVDNYSRETTLGKSGAVVEVFTSDSMNPTVFRVPENIIEVWDVFKVENGEIIPVNAEGAMICPKKIMGLV